MFYKLFYYSIVLLCKYLWRLIRLDFSLYAGFAELRSSCILYISYVYHFALTWFMSKVFSRPCFVAYNYLQPRCAFPASHSVIIYDSNLWDLTRLFNCTKSVMDLFYDVNETCLTGTRLIVRFTRNHHHSHDSNTRQRCIGTLQPYNILRINILYW